MDEYTRVCDDLERVQIELVAMTRRAVSAERALDDLQHDVGVFAECGLFMNGNDKESLRSDDSIPLLETLELMKDRFNTVSFRRARWRERAEQAEGQVKRFQQIAQTNAAITKRVFQHNHGLEALFRMLAYAMEMPIPEVKTAEKIVFAALCRIFWGKAWKQIAKQQRKGLKGGAE